MQDIFFEASYKEAKIAGFKTAINFVAPTNNFFKILYRHESALVFYKVSKLEIARDTIYPNWGEADSAFMKSYSMNKKWATNYLLFTPSEKEFKKKKKIKGYGAIKLFTMEVMISGLLFTQVTARSMICHACIVNSDY